METTSIIIVTPQPTIEEQRQIESSLGNDEYSSDEEMLANFIDWCPGFTPALLTRIIQQERIMFRLEPLHQIDWSEYGLPNGIWMP